MCFSSSVYSTILLALPIAPLWSATDSDACPVVTIGWQDSSSDRVEVRRGSAVLEFLSFGLETFPTDQFSVDCQLLNPVILALLGDKTFFCKRESLFGLTVHCFHFSPEQLYVQNGPNLGLLYLFDAIFSNTVPDDPKLSITDQNGPNCPNSSKIKIYQVGHGLDPSQDFSGLFQNFLITCFSFFCYLSAV